ncbi:hypothetical protein ACFSJS_23340 [Streptomyces desertarenae]|uniref:Uncharacterized protein n=1 Tax=Streptomyces desertarenae TaxID=2666184 RepID=A0ABW4PP87_9ACTN
MTYEISDTQIASFISHGPAAIEAYLESKDWKRNRGYGPRNIWYRQEVAWDLCPYCDDPGSAPREDPYCPLHDDAAWALVWPCSDGTTDHDVLHTLCSVEDRGPEEIIHALSLRDHDEIWARCSTSLWPEIRSVDSAINFFLSLDHVLASAAGRNTTADSESSYAISEHPYTAELVSEN